MNKLMVQLLLDYTENCLNKDWIIDMFSKCEHTDITDLKYGKFDIYPGKLYTSGDDVYVVKELDDDRNVVESSRLFKFDIDNMPYLTFKDPITITSKEAINVSGKIETTIGRYILNYMISIVPFGDAIPFKNEKMDLSSHESIIAEKFLDDEFTIAQLDTYLKNVFYLSNYSEFAAPSISLASITVDQKVIDLRDELFDKYKDDLDNPEVMMKIENELIALDKKILSEDPDKGFLISGKNFGIHRKRMFLTVGILPAFGDDDKMFNFVSTNLDKGWTKEDYPALVNDIRSGSYSRGKETAKGGAETKYLSRAFQETRIEEEDCGTTRGLKILLTDKLLDKRSSKNMLYRYCILNGKTHVVKDVLDKVRGKTVIIRSPQFCSSAVGYCYHCMDSRYKKLQLKRLNTLAMSIGSSFLTNSMKKMHGSTVDTIDMTVDFINEVSLR